jgi:fibronectin type 3 domain-containing protein
LYVNGVERKSETGLNLSFNRLKVGVNRINREPWKGFVDDLKIFGRTLTPAEVVEEFEGTLPNKVQNVAALNLGNDIGITWDAVEGVGTYRVYYSTSGNPTVADNFFQVQNATAATYPGAIADGVTYYFRVAAVNNIGAGELSDATNESSTTVTGVATIDPEIAARFTATGAEELTDLVTHTYNANGYSNLLPVFPDDLMRMVGTDNVTHTFATLANNTTVAMAPNPTAGNDSRYRYNDFRFTIHSFDQAEQNLYADYASKPECKDKDFRTLVSWMGCVGVEFVDRHTSFLSSRLPYYDRRSILPYTTLGADGVWQLQFKHHWWGFAWYTIIK